MEILLLLYLAGAFFTFLFVYCVDCNTFEVAMFTAVFYPVILTLYALILLMMSISVIICGVPHAIKEVLRRYKNDN